MDWYLDVLQNHYADFDGRARRKEFWMFVLFNILISLGITLIVGLVSDSLASLLSGLYSLAVLVPGIAVGVRRLHDTGKTGWLILLGLIPLINLVLLYFFAIEGDPGPNEYGPDPKDLDADDFDDFGA